MKIKPNNLHQLALIFRKIYLLKFHGDHEHIDLQDLKRK